MYKLILNPLDRAELKHKPDGLLGKTIARYLPRGMQFEVQTNKWVSEGLMVLTDGKKCLQVLNINPHEHV